MKKIFVILAGLLAFCTVSFGQTADKQKGAEMRFEKTEHNFGDVSHKAREIECSFDFTNEGDVPLVITKIVTSCTCTKADYPKKPVMPGQSGTIRIIYEPNKKDAGMFYKAIEVYSNSADAKRKTIVIRGKAV